ncbi:MAG: ketopantoate reductase family protein [Candidatus Limnocylindrales bacterium]
MRIVLVGAGAVGSLLGRTLASGGAEVTVLARPGMVAGRAELVTVDPSGARRSARVRVAVDPADVAEPPDLILCAVKAFDLSGALARLGAWPASTVLTVQNGIGAEEAVLAARPGAPLLAGSVTASVGLDADGTVHWLRRGGIGLAIVQGQVAVLRDDLLGLFGGGGLAARPYPDWAAMKWSKLLANLVGNATSAILDADPAAIYADPTLFAIERAQLREALTVLRAQGLRPVGLPGAPIPWLARAASLPPWLGRPILARTVGGVRGGKSPSLRSHFASGAAGPSEVDQLNGAVVAAGARLGLATPVNAALVAGVHAVAGDPSLRAWYRTHPASWPPSG